ncbi:MAG: hypothetical protein AAB732_00860 [Patescibacteria group bacterium]
MKKTIFFLLILFIFLSFVPVIQVTADTALTNPLVTTDPNIIITRIITVILGLVGVITLAMIIFGGLMWMTSGGSEEKVKKGRNILIWAILGLIVILSSYVILTFFIDTVKTVTTP